MSDPAPTSDIAALIERLKAGIADDETFAARMRQSGEDEEDIARWTDAQFLRDLATALAAQQAEIERLRARLECDGTNMGTGERVSVEPYDGIAVRDVMIADLRADLAARDETIRGLKERTLTDDDLYTLMCAAENLRSADHDDSRADAAFRIASQIDKLRARAILNSTEPSDD